MATKENTASTGAVSGIAVSAEVVHRPPNQIKVRIAFSGNGRECNVDLDSRSGCKCTMSGPLYPEDMLLLGKIVALLAEAKATYPPAS